MSKSNPVHYLVIFALTFPVYFWSASRTVVLEDDGLFIMAAYFNGIAHPPGYPLYTLLAHTFTWLPFGSVALRVHLLSGMFASLSCICLWLIAGKLLQNRICAYASALTLAYSNVFWSQAIIAEVYTLNALLILILLLLSLTISSVHERKSIARYCYLFMLVYGLGLSNHWPLVILSTPMFIAVIWPVYRDFFYACFKGLPWFFLGLLPYAWMVYRSHTLPEISFYGPISNFQDFWFYVSRQGYNGIDTSPSAGWHDKLLFCRFFLLENYRQFGPVGSCFLITGFLYQWRIFKSHLCSALVLGYLGSSVILIQLLGFDYDLLHRLTFRVYPVISYVITSLWIGVGIFMVFHLLQVSSSLKDRDVPVLILLCALVTAATFAHNVPANYRAEDRWAETYARVILKSLPEDSRIFLSDDVNAGPVGYINLVAGYRKDITLYSLRGQVFNNWIRNPLKVTSSELKNRIEEFIQTSTEPVFYTNDLIHDYGVEFYGPYFRVLKDKPRNYINVIANPEIISYLDFLQKAGTPWDPWEKMHYSTMMYDGCRTLTLIKQFSNDAGNHVADKSDKLMNITCDHLLGIYFRVDNLLKNKHPDLSIIKKLLVQAEKHLDESSLKAETALLDYYRGMLLLRLSRQDESIDYFRDSLKKWNHPDNPAGRELDKLNL